MSWGRKVNVEEEEVCGETTNTKDPLKGSHREASTIETS